ncbi:MAG: 4Fe-4S binding protein [Planctomycetes bacterium]|nr:4Fe-4S binding protein [Planctomycetota bacterium]
MASVIIERLRQKKRTMRYPDGPAPDLPERWLGEPEVDAALCDGCNECAEFCPTRAISAKKAKEPLLDLGLCIFCGACERQCPRHAVEFTRRFALSRYDRGGLVYGKPDEIRSIADPGRLAIIRSHFSTSLSLRQVSAGGCNACEADCNVLSTVAWDIGRFGINFTASPRHADGIMVTGPVTDNMKLALEKTYAAIPEPKVVIATGACAISGGIYRKGNRRGVLESMFPVDLYIPGCPPHPLVILEGLLRLLGRVAELG